MSRVGRGTRVGGAARFLAFTVAVSSAFVPLHPLAAQVRPSTAASAPARGGATTAAAPLVAVQERPLGTLREQADLQQQWLRLRLERVLPRLMREHGVAMWIIPVREYNEDPVF